MGTTSSSLEYEHPLPAAKLALQRLMRRNQFSWIHLLLFDLVGWVIEPRIRGLWEWRLFLILDLCFCALRFHLVQKMNGSSEESTRALRWFTWAAPLHSATMSFAVGAAYVHLGFDNMTMVCTLAVSIFAVGASGFHGSNLVLVRRVFTAFLMPAAIAALSTGQRDGVGVAAILIGVWNYCFHRSKIESAEFWQTLHSTRDLRISQKKQAELMAHRASQSAVVEERERIAAEWHDTLLAGFSAIGWQIDAAEAAATSQEVRAPLRLARTMLDHYRTEARYVIADLQSPASLRQSELSQGIAAALEPLRGNRDDVRIRVRAVGAEPVLNEQSRHQVTRICQEAVTNALKHGSPNLVDVAVHSDGESAWVEIRDDGAGFDTSSGQPASPGHFGLKIMQDRAKKAGGEVSVTSQPGNGVKVTVRIPNMNGQERTTARVLVVEDQYFFRLALHSVLDGRNGFEIAGEATTGAEALRMFRECKPDVTIMDLRLPDSTGFDIIKAIRAEDPEARIVVLSNLEGADHIHRATEAGAAAYLTKDASGSELLQAIRSVLSGRMFLPPPVARRLEDRHPDDELTARERDVVEQLVHGHSNRDIATRLGIAEKTVRVHMSSVLSKLGAHDRTQAAMIALQRGAVDPPGDRHQHARLAD